MTMTCKTCHSAFRNVDRDEDGTPEIPEQIICAHPDCETHLCPAGCVELSFGCEAWTKRFCNVHLSRQHRRQEQGGDDDSLHANLTSLEAIQAG